MNRVLIFLLCALLTACGGPPEKSAESKEQVVQASMQEAGETLYFSGEIKPIQEAVVTSPGDATVMQMPFDYGQAVKKDDVLFVIDSKSLQKNYDESLTAYLKAKDALAVQKAKFVGSQKLWDAGLISRNAYEADESSLYSSEMSFIQAKNKLAEIMAENHLPYSDALFRLKLSDTDAVKKALDKKTNEVNLKAPISGILLHPPKSDNDKTVRLGSHIKDGEVVGLIGDLSGFAIEVKVSEVDIDKIKPGLRVTVKGVTFQSTPLQGEVRKVNAQALASSSSGLPQFEATIVVHHIPEKLLHHIRIGMSAEIELSLKQQAHLTIPLSAVYRERNQTYVKLKQGGKTLVKPVSIGQASAQTVTVISGLKAGDSVIVNPGVKS